MAVGGWRSLLLVALFVPSLAAHAATEEITAVGRIGLYRPGAMLYLPLGNLLVVGTGYGELQVIDAGSGRPIRLLKGPLYSPAFSADEATMAAPGPLYSDYITLRDARSGKEIGRLQGRGRSLAYSPDGKSIAGVYAGYDPDGEPLAGSFHEVALWSVAARRKVAVLGVHRRARSVAFSPGGDVVAAAGGDDTIKLWSVGSRQEIATLVGHTGGVNCLAFSPDGGTLASGGDDTARLWNLRDRLQVATLAGHTGAVRSVAFSLDGQTLATGGDDHSVRLWDVASARATVALAGGTEGAVIMVAFRPDGGSLISGSMLGTDPKPTADAVRVWDLASRQQIDSFGPPISRVNKLSFSPDGQTIATSGGQTGEVVLWDIASGRRVDTLSDAENALYDPVFSPDGRVLAAGGSTGVTLWDVATRRPTGRLPGYGPPAFTPDGQLLAIGSRDQAVTIWDVASRRRLATVVGHADATYSVASSPDGSILAAASMNGERSAPNAVWLWDVAEVLNAARAIGTDVAMAAEYARWHGHEQVILDLEFSPDGRLLATGGRDLTTRLWDVAASREAAVLDAPDRSRAISFSPDGRMLASIGNFGTGTVWDVASRQEIATLTGPDGSFQHALGFSPDGTLLAAGGDGVFLWSISDVPTDVPTAVEAQGKAQATWAQTKRDGLAPYATAALPNYPNPFNPETWIPFDLSGAANVTVSIYDSAGNRVRYMDLGQRQPGAYRTKDRAAYWNGRTDEGEATASGVYFVELTAGAHRETRRIVMHK